MLITRWYWKLGYIVVAVVVLFALGRFFSGSVVAAIVWQVLSMPLTFAAFRFGTRVFRGKGESPERRPAWRWTARPRASRLLGSLCALSALLSLLMLPIDMYVPRYATLNTPVTVVSSLTSIVLYVVLSAFYFRSYSKLRGMTDLYGQPRPQREMAKN